MKLKMILAVTLMFLFAFALLGCEPDTTAAPAENTGVKQATVDTPVDVEGLTIEQKNIARRIVEDNKVGAIKFLYLLNPTTSECILFSPVQGKVTSGGKRLIPKTVSESQSSGTSSFEAGIGTRVDVRGERCWTQEVMNDDGTYGSSGEYLYWFTPDGRYFQVFVGTSTVLISDRPIRVKKIGIDLRVKQ